MSQTTRETLLHIAFGVLVVAALGMGGSDDLEEALAQEAYVCQHHQPAPAYCRDR